MTTTTVPRYEYAIQYDPETRDFAMYLNGELVGFERSQRAAEIALDTMITALIHRHGGGDGAVTMEPHDVCALLASVGTEDERRARYLQLAAMTPAQVLRAAIEYVRWIEAQDLPDEHFTSSWEGIAGMLHDRRAMLAERGVEINEGGNL